MVNFITFKRLVIIMFKGYFFLCLEVSDSYLLRLVFLRYGVSDSYVWELVSYVSG